MSKAKQQARHAKKRARERYGLSLSKKDLEDIVKKIQTNQGRFLERISDRLSAWEIPLKGDVLVVLYDRQRKTLATLLPKECHEREARRTLTQTGRDLGNRSQA